MSAITGQDNDALRVNGGRLWDSLMQMARIGATKNGGVTRLALSDEDKQARDLFVQWVQEAGCSVRVDAMGNIFARRPGRDNALAPVATGSHGDSQPQGGRFDGIYGVLAGLEVIRSLNDAGVQTLRPVEVVNWTNEEGARFAPAMVASGVFSGVFALEYGLSRTDGSGLTIRQELERIGYAGADIASYPIHAFYELHIEQGPILEAENLTIGVVSGGQGQRWYEGDFSGQAAHAGTTPMNRRRDAARGLAAVIELAHDIAVAHGPLACATVGSLQVTPNSRNVVPGRAGYTLEFRHPDEDILAAMHAALKEGVTGIAARLNLGSSLKQIFSYPPVVFDSRCVGIVRAATAKLAYPFRDIVSGAGHDACYINRIAPTAMIFIPCVDGISHNEREDISEQWSTAGGNVLLQSLLHSASS
jgi:N-carbamoyl-L-amino-acid hydrolase